MITSLAPAMLRTFPATAMVMATLIAGCTSMGNGSGTESPDGKPVEFAWDSKDGGITGDMSATLGGNASFSGPFLQITSTTQTNDLAPLWYGWHAGW